MSSVSAHPMVTFDAWADSAIIEKRDAASEDPYAYYKKPNIYGKYLSASSTTGAGLTPL